MISHSIITSLLISHAFAAFTLNNDLTNSAKEILPQMTGSRQGTKSIREMFEGSPKSLLSLSSKIFIKAASEGNSDVVNAFLKNIKYDVGNPDTSDAFSPILIRAAKAASDNGHQETMKSINYQLALNSRSNTPKQLEPIILTLDKIKQQELLVGAASQNHESLLQALYLMKKDYLDYNKAIETAAIHGNFDLVNQVFDSNQAADAYYQLALISKTLSDETYKKLISSLPQSQKIDLFYDSASNGNTKILNAFTVDQVANYGLSFTDWIYIAAKNKHWADIIQHFLPTELNSEVIWTADDYLRLYMVRDILQQSTGKEKEELLRFLIFKEAAEVGDISVMKIFFANPKHLKLNWQLESMKEYFAFTDPGIWNRKISSKLLMVMNGILLASSKSQVNMLKYLMGKIDITAQNNLLLNVAASNGDKRLVNLLLQSDRVVKAGLDNAMEVTDSKFIWSLLHKKSIISSE